MAAYLTVTEEQRQNFVVCRSLGHAWFEIDDTREHTTAWRVWKFRISLRCERCGTERYDGINVHGEVGQREYRYPEDYKYAVHETPSRQEFRLIMLRRRKERKT